MVLSTGLCPCKVHPNPGTHFTAYLRYFGSPPLWFQTPNPDGPEGLWPVPGSSALPWPFPPVNPAAWLVDRLYHKPIVPCPVLPLRFPFSGSSLYSSTVEDLCYLSTRVFPNGLRSSQSYGFTRPRDLSSVCTAQCRFAFLRVTPRLHGCPRPASHAGATVVTGILSQLIDEGQLP